MAWYSGRPSLLNRSAVWRWNPYYSLSSPLLWRTILPSTM